MYLLQILSVEYSSVLYKGNQFYDTKITLSVWDSQGFKEKQYFSVKNVN